MSAVAEISGEQIAGPLAESMPEVTAPPQATAPAAVPAPAAAPAAPLPAKPESSALGNDSIGRPFDASKFRAEKDRLGRWKNLKAGRPVRTAPAAQPGPASVLPPEDPAPAKAPEPAQVSGDDRFSLAAESYLFAAYSVLDGVFSGKGEWMPDDKAEHQALKNSLALWLRSRGSDDLPPGAAFTLAAVGFSAKRIQRPNTRTRWYAWWIGIRAWFGNRRAQAKIDAVAAVSPAVPPSP